MSKRAPIFVISPLPPGILETLSAEYSVVTAYDPAARAAAVARHGAEFEVIVTTAWGKVDAAAIAALPALKLIANCSVGLDGIDLAAARARGVAVTNTPGVLDDAVADLALGLMLAVTRRLCAADAFVRSQAWQGGSFPLATGLAGKCCGILGLGSIGLAIARRAQAFGLRIAYHNRRPRADVDYAYHAGAVELAAASDILVAALPATADSRHIVAGAVLDALGPQGFLINIARGSVVDEAALLAALQQGRIAGAGLDVFETEPHPLPGLLALDTIVLAPHIGSATHETRAAMGHLTLDNVRAFFAGEKLLTPVQI